MLHHVLTRELPSSAAPAPKRGRGARWKPWQKEEEAEMGRGGSGSFEVGAPRCVCRVIRCVMQSLREHANEAGTGCIRSGVARSPKASRAIFLLRLGLLLPAGAARPPATSHHAAPAVLWPSYMQYS